MNAPLVSCRNVSFGWKDAQSDWFHDLSLELKTGHVYGLLGKNGAGKTTLIKLLCGALRPYTGTVSLRSESRPDEDISVRMPPTLREVIFVPESVALPDLSVETLGEVMGDLYPRFDRERYRDVLKLFEVPLSTKISRLSFGQKRKVHISFALATQARLVLLDEPTNGLDIAAQITLRKLLVSQITADHSVIVSTHHVREFETIIDHVLVLEKGKLLAESSVEALQSDANFQGLEGWYARLIGITTSSLPGGQS